VKLDDIGLHLADRSASSARAVGNALVRTVPSLLQALSGIGTAAMLWVGGGILVHGLEELHVLEAVPRLIHDAAHAAAEAAGAAKGLISWLVNALGGAIVGLVVGGSIAAIVRRLTKHPEELIVD
jgi:predicted DNA repair protein MutK